MSNSSYLVANILDKLQKIDSDFRFMAVSDLRNELQRPEFYLDHLTEPKIIEGCLNALTDSNSEVQNMAMKCIGPLALKIKSCLPLTKKLCSLLGTTESTSDVAAMGLKSMLYTITRETEIVMVLVIDRIIELLNNDQNLDLIDILVVVMERFSVEFKRKDISFHRKIQGSLMELMENKRPVIRKRTTLAIVTFLNNSYNEINEAVCEDLIAKLKVDERYLFVVYELLKNSKMAPHIPIIIMKTKQYLDSNNESQKEECIDMFERLCSAQLLSPSERAEVLQIGLEYLKYDPHFNEDYDESMESSSESEFEASDDEDESWKVRKAAARLLSALAAPEIYGNLASHLINRFHERIEMARLEIFDAFIALISKIENTQKRKASGNEIDFLQNDCALIIQKLLVHLVGNENVTISRGFKLIRKLVIVLQGGLENEVGNLLPAISAPLSLSRTTMSNTNLKIEVLQLLSVILQNHDIAKIENFVYLASDSVVEATLDSFYKVRSEALSVIVDIVAALKKGDESTRNSLDLAEKLLSALLNIFADEKEAEVLEHAISTTAFLVTCFPAIANEERLQSIAKEIVDQLAIESTRLCSIDAICALSSLAQPGSYWQSLIPQIQINIIKSHKPIVNASVPCLVSLLRKSNDISVDMLISVGTDCSQLIETSAIGFSLLNALLELGLTHSKFVEFFKSSMLQGFMRSIIANHNSISTHLPHLLEVWDTIFEHEAELNVFDDVIRYYQQETSNIPKSAYSTVAKCIGRSYKLPQTQNFLNNLFVAIDGEQIDHALFALYCIGEFGTYYDMAVKSPSLRPKLNSFLESGQEEIKHGAAYCIGLTSISNLAEAVPILVEAIKESPNHHYYIMAMNELIMERTRAHKTEELKPFVNSIWNIFFSIVDSVREETRPIMADCLGKLVLIDGKSGFSTIVTNSSSISPKIRALAVSTFRYSLQHLDDDLMSIAYDSLSSILNLVNDEEVSVRKLTLETLNVVLHSKTIYVRHIINQLVPIVCSQTKFRKELVTVVKMGPFEKKVDSGLDNRKQAFECILTMLSADYDLDYSHIMEAAVLSVTDTSAEIVLLCYNVLTVLISKNYLIGLERVVQPLRKTVFKQMKETATKQELFDYAELISSSLRLCVAINEVYDTVEWKALVSEIKAAKEKQRPDDSGLVIAGLGDLQRPADKLSVTQTIALAATGLIWSRYSMVIIPKNYNLFSVNMFVGGIGLYQLSRIARHHMENE